MVKRILLATDSSPWARRATDYACAIACSWKASLTVLSVVEFMPGLNPDYPVNQQYLSDLLKHASERLVDLKARAERSGISVTTRMATGIPSEEVIAAARTEDSDLIIVGTRGKTGLAHVLLGSTAERVIRGAPCPVLTVRTEPAEADQGQGTLSMPVTLARILVPVDFSDCSRDALAFAVRVAQQAEASIILLHVLEPASYGLDFTLGNITPREELRMSWTQRLEELASSHRQPQCTRGDSTARGPSERFDLRRCSDAALRPHHHGDARAPWHFARLLRQRRGSSSAKSSLSGSYGAYSTTQPIADG